MRWPVLEQSSSALDAQIARFCAAVGVWTVDQLLAAGDW
jgi:hypothetical protein